MLLLITTPSLSQEKTRHSNLVKLNEMEYIRVKWDEKQIFIYDIEEQYYQEIAHTITCKHSSP